MAIRTGILLMINVLSLATVGTAQVETEKLIKSIYALKSYEYGDTGGADTLHIEPGSSRENAWLGDLFLLGLLRTCPAEQLIRIRDLLAGCLVDR